MNKIICLINCAGSMAVNNKNIILNKLIRETFTSIEDISSKENKKIEVTSIILGGDGVKGVKEGFDWLETESAVTNPFGIASLKEAIPKIKNIAVSIHQKEDKTAIVFLSDGLYEFDWEKSLNVFENDDSLRNIPIAMVTIGVNDESDCSKELKRIFKDNFFDEFHASSAVDSFIRNCFVSDTLATAESGRYIKEDLKF